MSNKKTAGLFATVKKKAKKAVVWGLNKLFATSKDGVDIHARAKKRKEALDAAGRIKD